MAKTIAQLKAPEAKANAELDNTEHRFTNMQKDITELYERLDRLDQQVERLEEQTEQLQAQIQEQDKREEEEDRKWKNRREEEDRKLRSIHDKLNEMTQRDGKFSTEISKLVQDVLTLHDRIGSVKLFQAVQLKSYQLGQAGMRRALIRDPISEQKRREGNTTRQ